MTVDVAK
jgi:hypothetical protein